MSYDKNADVLYVTFEDVAPGSYLFVENEAGDILKVDRTSSRVVGCTVPFFGVRARNGKLAIPEIGSVPFNALAEDLVHT